MAMPVPLDTNTDADMTDAASTCPFRRTELVASTSGRLPQAFRPQVDITYSKRRRKNRVPEAVETELQQPAQPRTATPCEANPVPGQLPTPRLQPNSTQEACLPFSTIGHSQDQSVQLVDAPTLQPHRDTAPGSLAPSVSRPAAPRLYIRPGLGAATGAVAQRPVQPGDGCAALQAAARPSATAVPVWPPKAASARRPLTQLHLDAGQANFAHTTCKVCGLMYAQGEKRDEKLHAAYHTSVLQGIKFQGWTNERVLRQDGAKGRILLVLPTDSGAHLKKVKEIAAFLDEQMGLVAGWLLSVPCKVFLYVSAAKRVVGCVITERISTAYPVTASLDDETADSGWQPHPRESAQDEQTAEGSGQCSPSVPMQLNSAGSPLAVVGSQPCQQGAFGTANEPAAAVHAQAHAFDAACGALKDAAESGPDTAAPSMSDMPKTPAVAATAHQLAGPSPSTHLQPAPMGGAFASSTLARFSHKSTLLTRWLVSTKPSTACKTQHSSPRGMAASGRQSREGPATCPPCFRHSMPSRLSMSACSAPIATASDPTGMHAAHSACSSRADQPACHNPPTAAISPTPCSPAASQHQHHPSTHPHLAGLLRKAAAPQHTLLMTDLDRPMKAICGVRLVWVSLEARRQGIASQLLDMARCNCLAGYIVPRRELAFSQPTSDGQAFARRYTGCRAYLVYS